MGKKFRRWKSSRRRPSQVRSMLPQRARLLSKARLLLKLFRKKSLRRWRLPQMGTGPTDEGYSFGEMLSERREQLLLSRRVGPETELSNAVIAVQQIRSDERRAFAG